MSPGEVAGFVSIFVTLLLGLLAWRIHVRAQRTSEKKLTVEERAALAEARQAQFESELKLDEYISAKVDKRVEKLITERVEPLEKELAKERAEKVTLVGAFTRILRAISAQNPPEHPGYVFDQADVTAIEGTIPIFMLPKRRAS